MKLRLLVQLGWRNLWRHKRRNGILLGGITFAVAAVILANSFIRGMQVQMVDNAVDLMNGHIKILAPGYLDDPGVAQSFELAKDWRPDALEGITPDMVAGWASRIRVPAVIMSERETRGIQLVGVDPASENISFVGKLGISGEPLADAADRRVIVGAALAERIETQVGRRIVLITQGADGRNREAGYRVAGVYRAETASLEKIFVFTGRDTVQNLLETTVVTELSLRLTEDRFSPPILQRLANVFTGLDVLSWQQLDPTAAALTAIIDVVILVYFFIMMGALSFGLVNSLVTAVMERTREMGMMRAIGMRPRAVLLQVVLESTLIMGAGIAGGVLIGLLAFIPIAGGVDLGGFDEALDTFGLSNVLVPQLVAGDVILVVVLSLILGFVASASPAVRSMKMGPLEAMRR